MYYALERLVFQGTEKCPQYEWKQLALCANREILESARRQMRRLEDWRIVPMVFDCLPAEQLRRIG